MTGGTRKLVIRLSINYGVINRGDHYAAQTEQFGLTVYSPTREDLEPRIEEAIQFYLKGFREDLGKVFDYFGRHEIGYSVQYDPPDSAQHDTRDQLTMQVAT